MNYKVLVIAVSIVAIVGVAVGKSMIKAAHHSQVKKNIKIILGSTREGRSSEKIAQALLQMVSKRTDIDIQLLDLKEYALPFLHDSVAPMMRKGEITDPVLKKWSDAVTQADAFIVVVPEYNAGYPGVLKNALDVLYKEWNNKPVAFVGYSGGPNGGVNAISQLKQVVKELQMKPIATELLIPFSWKAFDKQGQLVDAVQSEKTINLIIDELMVAFWC